MVPERRLRLERSTARCPTRHRPAQIEAKRQRLLPRRLPADLAILIGDRHEPRRGIQNDPKHRHDCGLRLLVPHRPVLPELDLQPEMNGAALLEHRLEFLGKHVRISSDARRWPPATRSSMMRASSAKRRVVDGRAP